MVRLFISKGPMDKAFIKMVSDEQKKLGRSLPIYSLMILNTLKQLNRSSVSEIAEYIKAEEKKIRINIEALTESGLVE
ncbi:MAG: AAA family ATPase, partial [Clostridiales bacterium]|nr:AAA family ATPase [Clostridiales bacterium]